MFDRNDINLDKQFFGICVPFSYCKTVAAIHGIPNDYIQFLVDYITFYNPKMSGIIHIGTDIQLIHKLVDCIGWDLRLYRKAKLQPDFDINYTFLDTDVSINIHKSYPVNTTVGKYDISAIVNDPPSSDLSLKPNFLINFAFKIGYLINNKPVIDWHSVIVGYDKQGLYIVDPNHDTPYPFADVYTKYHILELGECISVTK